MWPLHARSKDEYIRLIEQLMDRQDLQALAEMLRQAYDDYRQEEDFTAWCASVAYGHELPDALEFHAEFMHRFPLSLQPVQVDYAEQLIMNGHIDDGANEARAYLHRVNEAGFDLFGGYELVLDGVSRSFIMLTSVYTEAGARNYSRRVLEQAMLHQLETHWQQRFRAEYLRLEEELHDESMAKLDAMWESFFQRGENAGELMDLCTQCMLPILRKRIEVLAQMFADDPEFKPGDEEIFQLLFETDRGAFVLA